MDTNGLPKLVNYLVNDCKWQKECLLIEMKTYFYFKFVYIHSALSANKGIFMDYSSLNNCWFNSQELTISRPRKPSNCYGFCRLVHGTPEGFVFGF